MTHKKSTRLLPYKNLSPTRKFSGGGVTFYEEPTKYNPETDFARKEAKEARALAAKREADQKKLNTKKDTAKDKYYKPKFLNNGLKGYREFANDTIAAEIAKYDQQITANGSEWATTYEGKRSAANIERLTSELTAENANIQAAYDEVVGSLQPGDLDSQAFVNGAYVAEVTSGENKGQLVHLLPEEYYKNTDKYSPLTVRNALSKYKDMPEITSDAYRVLGSVKSGETFFKKNIKNLAGTIEAVDKAGVQLPVESLQAGYDSLLKDGTMTKDIYESGAKASLSSMWSNIMSDSSAKNALLRRVWSDNKYRNIINNSDDKNSALTNVMYAEMYRLAMLDQHPDKAGKSGGSGGSGGSGSGKITTGVGHEIYGVDRELNKTVQLTEFDTHLDESTREILSYYPASRVPQLASLVDTEMTAAKNSDTKSATLEDLTEFKSWVDPNGIHTVTGMNIAEFTGLSNREFKSRAVIADPEGMLTVNVPSMPDGTPLQGYSAFMQEYQAMFANTATGTKFNVTGNSQQANAVKRKKVLDEMIKTHGGDEIGQVIQYLRGTKQEIPTSQKIFTEVMFYGDKGDMEDANGKDQMLIVGDATDSQDWYEQRNKQSTGLDGLNDDYMTLPVLIDIVTPGNAFGRGSLNPSQVEGMVQGLNQANKLSLDDILSQLE